MLFSRLTKIVLFTFTFVSINAFADMDGKSSILANLSMAAGGAAFGADYEYGIDSKLGVGGLLRMHPDDDKTGYPGLTVIGGFIRPHFTVKKWDFYMSPGFAMIMIKPANPNADDESMIGPTLSYGLLYMFNDKMSFGVEDSTYYGWFGEDAYKTSLRPSVMAKFRYNL